jgi:hypothetical protein
MFPSRGVPQGAPVYGVGRTDRLMDFAGSPSMASGGALPA